MNENRFAGDDNSRPPRRDVAERASEELARIKRVGSKAGGEISSYVRKQPLAALGIALGTGFVLGSVVGSRLGRMALVAVAGYAAQELIEGALGKGALRRVVVSELAKLATPDASETTRANPS
jgi:hypothetical protein